jgi:threonine dehydrogenase-like Zn-dependent dehydrogenase
MRYPASEKLEIIRLIERSHLPVQRTLEKLGIPRTTFNATREDFDRVLSAIRHGEVVVGRLITHRTLLNDAVRNIPRWATDMSGLIKAVVEVG